MRPSGWLLLSQLSICAALGASAALYVHYLNPADSDFCGPTSGCEAVRRSGLSYFFGSRFISLPLFALVAFGALLGLSLRRRDPEAARAQGSSAKWWRDPALTLFAASWIGGVLGVMLIAYQALVISEFCWLCVIVNLSAILTAGFAFLAAKGRQKDRQGVVESPLSAGAWLGIAGVLVVGPIVWGAIKPLPPVPSAIAALYQPGKINVVEFADFECPYCRRLHTVLAPLVAEYGEQVHFRRVHRPLSQHVHAEAAARAALCAEAQGKGEEMADELFSATLSPEAIGTLAERLRLDPAFFDACMASEQVTAKLLADAALLPDEQLRGLPTTYIGQKMLVGVPTEAALRDAFERAKRAPTAGPSGPLYVGLLATLIAVLAFFGQRRPRPRT